MTRERYIKLIAGTFVLSSSLLAYFVNINWILVSAFVGANLLQFSLSKWCLMDTILKALGVRSATDTDGCGL